MRWGRREEDAANIALDAETLASFPFGGILAGTLLDYRDGKHALISIWGLGFS